MDTVDTGSGTKVGDFRHSELQLVVLQVLTVLGSIEAQFSVGYECRYTWPKLCSFTSYHPVGLFRVFNFSIVSSTGVVICIFQLVEELDGDSTFKWPL